mgnify:CR=1 FL=1
MTRSWDRVSRGVCNAGAALFVADRVESVREGIGVAASVIDSGAALATLETMVKASPAEAVA